MDSLLDGLASPDDLDPPPDGAGYWPDTFVIHKAWADGRTSVWRSVTGNPTIQARRPSESIIELRLTSGDTTPRSYSLSLDTVNNVQCYVAQLEA